MRCIQYPTMVKDGSAWGALGGVSAAYLAADGFTGAPAVSIEDESLAHLWDDFGTTWRILEQYFKPHSVCRWAQPAIEAVTGTMTRHRITGPMIDHIEIASFSEAISLATRIPKTTEAAQYSLPFSVAAAAMRGQVGAAELTGAGLDDPEVLRKRRFQATALSF